MKWHAQVAHVARKDVRQFRWMIAAYALVVAAATAEAGWSAFGADMPLLWMFVLVVTGMVLLAVLVQADSPARSTPFWVTLPLHSSAVFTAKLVVGVLVVLGLALAGQAVALSAHAVSAGDLPGLLGRSAVAFGLWLGTAAVIAALAPDLRTFLLALTLTTLSWFIGATIIWSSLASSEHSGPLPLLVRLAAVLCMVALLAHQYLTRRMRLGLAAVALLWVAGLLVPPLVSRSIADHAAGVVPGPLRAATIIIDSVQFHSGLEPMMRIRVKGLSPVHNYVLMSPVVELRMENGSSAPVHTNERFIWLGHGVVRLEGIRWVNRTEPAQETQEFNTGVGLTLTPAQRRALEQGRARLSLRGRVEVREPRVKMDLPAVAGAAAARQGLRMRVTRAEVLAQGPSVEVRASSVASSRSAGSRPERWSGPRLTDHVLVNRSRGEGLTMNQRNNSGSDGGLVLPGPSVAALRVVLEPVGTPSPESGVEAGWLNGARLLVLEWVPLGSYPVAIQQQSP
jgi:hypothetical protein